MHGRDQGQGGRARRSVPQAAPEAGPRPHLPGGSDGPGPRHRQQHDRDQGDRLGPLGPRRRRGPGRRAAARSRPRLDGAERRGLVAIPRRRAARSLPDSSTLCASRHSPSATSARPWASWTRPAPRSGRRSCGSTSAAAPTSTCSAASCRPSSSAPSPARRPTRRPPCSACTGCSAASPSIGAARRISSTCWAISAGASPAGASRAGAAPTRTASWTSRQLRYSPEILAVLGL